MEQGGAVKLAIYYEGGTVDRHWLAPDGFGIVKAKRHRVSRLYKTHEGARRALVAAADKAKRESKEQ